MFLFKRKKKAVRVMNGKSFIAAYSELPFEEAQGSQYPDYSFHTVGEMNWCVRIGDITVGWGFGKRDAPFVANGTLTVSRRNVSAVSFHGRGLPYVREGDIYYLYEGENTANGFAEYLRVKICEGLKEIARRSTSETFRQEVQALGDLPEMQRLLDEHKLVLKSVSVDRVVE